MLQHQARYPSAPAQESPSAQGGCCHEGSLDVLGLDELLLNPRCPVCSIEGSLRLPSEKGSAGFRPCLFDEVVGPKVR
ncbi:hypothetical protein [Hyalangium versicolor]|uniref:hypothetical protein n=1 Tax=Hyalangium versicolor TaxID=2861190 RepID=UPI001CD000A2|nr:hypothetical protein [Hyalangium versicolor]